MLQASHTEQVRHLGKQSWSPGACAAQRQTLFASWAGRDRQCARESGIPESGPVHGGPRSSQRQVSEANGIGLPTLRPRFSPYRRRGLRDQQSPESLAAASTPQAILQRASLPESLCLPLCSAALAQLHDWRVSMQHPQTCSAASKPPANQSGSGPLSNSDVSLPKRTA